MDQQTWDQAKIILNITMNKSSSSLSPKHSWRLYSDVGVCRPPSPGAEACDVCHQRIAAPAWGFRFRDKEDNRHCPGQTCRPSPSSFSTRWYFRLKVVIFIAIVFNTQNYDTSIIFLCLAKVEEQEWPTTSQSCRNITFYHVNAFKLISTHQEYLNALTYNHTGTQLFDIKPHSSMITLMETARIMVSWKWSINQSRWSGTRVRSNQVHGGGRPCHLSHQWHTWPGKVSFQPAPSI